MGRLRKTIAGLAALLSLGSVAGNNANVFATDSETLLSSFNQDDLKGVKTLANLTKDQVNAKWGQIKLNNKQIGNHLYELQEKVNNNKNPSLGWSGTYNKKSCPEKLQDLLLTHTYYDLGNGLICDETGKILTYGDLGIDMNLKDTPILSYNSQICCYKGTSLMMSQYSYFKLKKNPIKNHEGKLRVRNGKLCNLNGNYLKINADGALEETDEEDALEIDNDTFGLEEYVEPMEEIELAAVENASQGGNSEQVNENKEEENEFVVIGQEQNENIEENKEQENQEDKVDNDEHGTDIKNNDGTKGNHENGDQPDGVPAKTDEKMSTKKKIGIGAGVVAAATAFGGGGIAAYKNKDKLLGNKRRREKTDIKEKSNKKEEVETKNDKGKAF